MDQFQIINSEMTLVWTYQHLRTSCLQEFPYTLADFQSADLHSRMDDLLCSHHMHTSLKVNVKFKLWFDYSHKIWTIMPIKSANQRLGRSVLRITDLPDTLPGSGNAVSQSALQFCSAHCRWLNPSHSFPPKHGFSVFSFFRFKRLSN